MMAAEKNGGQRLPTKFFPEQEFSDEIARQQILKIDGLLAETGLLTKIMLDQSQHAIQRLPNQDDYQQKTFA